MDDGVCRWALAKQGISQSDAALGLGAKVIDVSGEFSMTEKEKAITNPKTILKKLANRWWNSFPLESNRKKVLITLVGGGIKNGFHKFRLEPKYQIRIIIKNKIDLLSN